MRWVSQLRLVACRLTGVCLLLVRGLKVWGGGRGRELDFVKFASAAQELSHTHQWAGEGHAVGNTLGGAQSHSQYVLAKPG